MYWKHKPDNIGHERLAMSFLYTWNQRVLNCSIVLLSLVHILSIFGRKWVLKESEETCLKFATILMYMLNPEIATYSFQETTSPTSAARFTHFLTI